MIRIVGKYLQSTKLNTPEDANLQSYLPFIKENEIFQDFKINFEIKNLICSPVKKKSACIKIEHVKNINF
jgi:hypothetical protein